MLIGTDSVDANESADRLQHIVSALLDKYGDDALLVAERQVAAGGESIEAWREIADRLRRS